MEYKVHELARLSGVSDRTLRYYDNIGLLRPSRCGDGEYRLYGEREVDRLQEILFYRELGVGLSQIGALLDAPGRDRARALRDHLQALKEQKERIGRLIENVEDTLQALKGEKVMTDKEKFEGFKRELVEENEKKYGAEVRKKYGETEVDASNKRFMGMSEAQWERQQTLAREINDTLKAAMEQGDPAGELAQKACALHREWIILFWGEKKYSKQAHRGLAEMYVADERFKAHYDKIADGAAEFFRSALDVYCK